MGTTTLPFQNRHVTLQNGEININYGSKKFKISLNNINKIYLSKRKTGYFSGIFDNLLLMRSNNFKLYIHTKDNNSVAIEIPDYEKQYFVNLISWIRHHTSTGETAAA